MQDLIASEVAANTNEREAIADRMRFARPELNRAIRALHPLAVVGMEKDRNVPKTAAPFDHRRVVVRMRNRDGRQASQCAHHFNGVFINQADAIPEDVLLAGLYQQGSLPDSKFWFGRNAPHAGAFLKENVAVLLLQLLEWDPLLSPQTYVLSFILTNRTGRGRIRRWRELGAASEADVSLHASI